MNELISGARVLVENTIAGVKRCRIVKDVFRNTKDGFSDLVRILGRNHRVHVHRRVDNHPVAVQGHAAREIVADETNQPVTSLSCSHQTLTDEKRLAG